MSPREKRVVKPSMFEQLSTSSEMSAPALLLFCFINCFKWSDCFFKLNRNLNVDLTKIIR